MKWIRANIHIILLLSLFAIHAFFLFYQLTERMSFANDQVNNAWAAVRILIEHRYPLVGMVAKANSGLYIGPAYYYLVALFYWITNLHPIASPLLAGFTGLLSFGVLYFVTKKLFNPKVALWASVIYVFPIGIITSDRTQWPVNFIPLLSYLIFYLLYKILNGSPKHIMYLAATIGIFFHIHITAIFFPIITLASLPFFPWSRETIKYILISLPIFAVFFIPNALYEAQSQTFVRNATGYGGTYSHGFHLRRFLQIWYYPYFELNKILPYPNIGVIFPSLAPLFAALSFDKKRMRRWFTLVYLIALWILVPWIIFAMYSGEISDYYFSSFRFIAIALLAYFSWRLAASRILLLKIIPYIFWTYFAVSNTLIFLKPYNTGFAEKIKQVKVVINVHQEVPFAEGDAHSYYYYWLMHTEPK